MDRTESSALRGFYQTVLAYPEMPTELSKLFSSLFWLNKPQAFNTGPAFNSFSQACEVNN